MDMKVGLLSGAMALGVALAVAGGANAALRTETISFTATNFVGGTIDPVSGSFTLTLDPTQSYGLTPGVTINSLNIPGIDAAGVPVFSYDPGIGTAALEIRAGNFFTFPGFILNLADGGLAVLNGNGTGILGGNNFALYNLSGEPHTSYTGTYTVTSGAPEPAAWALMLMGFGAIGLALRRRPSAQAVV